MANEGNAQLVRLHKPGPLVHAKHRRHRRSPEQVSGVPQPSPYLSPPTHLPTPPRLSALRCSESIVGYGNPPLTRNDFRVTDIPARRCHTDTTGPADLRTLGACGVDD